MSTQMTGIKVHAPTGAMEGYSAGPRTSDFLRRLFRHLDESGTRYCVLHSWRTLPDELPSDLDIAVHPADRTSLAVTFRRLSDDGFPPIQLINHNVNGNYFVFCWHSGKALQTAAVDVIFEHRRCGLIAAGGTEVTATRERCGEFWVASPSTEFAYLILKKVAKGKVKPEQADRLRELVVFLSRSRAEKIVQEVFSAKWSQIIVSACLDGTLPEVLPNLGKLPWITAVSRHPVELLRYLAGDIWRVLRRWRRPNGVLIAILGPDGVGKSSVIVGLHDQLGPAFWGERYFHWRPQFFARRRQAAPVTDPHAKPPRGPLASSLYLTVFLFDYWLGYAFVLRQLKPRSHFLSFDRYFYDVLADPLRIRFGGPKWLAQFYSRLVPTPDLVLLLDADTETILARKSEVPPEEVNRQREAYRHLPLEPSHLRVMRTEGTREEVVYEAVAFVAEYMSRRFEATYPEWLAAHS
jgi:thymidylate kinase